MTPFCRRPAARVRTANPTRLVTSGGTARWWGFSEELPRTVAVKREGSCGRVFILMLDQAGRPTRRTGYRLDPAAGYHLPPRETRRLGGLDGLDFCPAACRLVKSPLVKLDRLSRQTTRSTERVPPVRFPPDNPNAPRCKSTGHRSGGSAFCWSTTRATGRPTLTRGRHGIITTDGWRCCSVLKRSVAWTAGL